MSQITARSNFGESFLNSRGERIQNWVVLLESESELSELLLLLEEELEVVCLYG